MAVTAGDLPGFAAPLGGGMFRPAGAGDAVDGVMPRVVAEPDTPEALADILKWCNGERLAVVIRGGGTKLDWGRRSSAIDVVLSTSRLNRVLAHAHGDLTATVEAGSSIRQFNAQLAGHGQWLPIDVAFDEATVGGTIATNDSGSLRHRYGTTRDVLIGIRLATTDGLLVKSGGNVVKNVAGYDLGRLMSGSLGSLAAIVSATFKLSPRPVASATLVVTCSGAKELSTAAAAIWGSQLEPAAFDVRITAGASRRHQLLLQFATTPGAIAQQVERAETLVAGAGGTEVIAGSREAELWTSVAHGPWLAGATIVRLSWLQSSLPAVLALVEDLARGAPSIDLVGRVVVGSGLLRIEAGMDAQSAVIERLRGAADVVGNVVVLRADSRIKNAVGVSGPSGDTIQLLREIKRAFDPTGILNGGLGLAQD